LTVKTLEGESFEISFDYKDDVLELKNKIHDIYGVSPDNQRLLYSGKQLEDDKKLSDYNINNKSIIYIVIRYRGG
ncbi:hypothetical protein PIROE2DRAFT_23238, partial [Piromyces sp. E2]